MDRTYRQLLCLLSAAMDTRKDDVLDMQAADWNKLFFLSQNHNIIPMIYESAQKTEDFSLANPELSHVWRKQAINISLNQMYRTMEFLKVYDKLNQAGIQALVVKGIICRELYPNHDYRSSGDEDVYIRKIDFKQVDSIFRTFGLVRDKSKKRESPPEQVTTYRSSKYGLIIELHVDLFSPESELFGPLNKFFGDVFEDSITINVEEITVHTLSHDMHLLFLILHSIKHFMSIGFGIRQVCDLVMYSNAYGQEIDWSSLWSRITELGYEVFLLNLFDIGTRYLGLDQRRIRYPEGYLSSDIHSEALLVDIIQAGIFGKSELGRVKTSSMTLHAVSEDRKPRGAHAKKYSNLRAFFPGLKFMGSHYAYCRKYPMLLPIAWLHRFIVYAAEEKNLSIMISKAGSSFAIGRKRIELLKEYRLIGRMEEVSE